MSFHPFANFEVLFTCLSQPNSRSNTDQLSNQFPDTQKKQIYTIRTGTEINTGYNQYDMTLQHDMHSNKDKEKHNAQTQRIGIAMKWMAMDHQSKERTSPASK
jgi:hypothetical protein